jgi:aryl-alcohol dehydrogenase-like predicted oxidoreductase
MEQIEFVKSDLITSRIGLGTWAMGGWMWGGTDEAQSIATIRSAIDRGVTLIDTAPVYGFGRSEEIVGKALEGSLRQKVTIATKVGLAWKDDAVYRDSRPARIRKEIEDSLRRLRTDVIDLYQVHWPDFEMPIAETARTLEDLRREGKIRAIGVSNFSPTQMRMFSADAQLDAVQPPYNLFERDIEVDVLPYAVGAGLTVLSYGALCRGLLSGRMDADTKFAMISATSIQNSKVSATFSISLRSMNSRSWHTNASANRCWRLRCVGCSIKDRRLPCGVLAILVS